MRMEWGRVDLARRVYVVDPRWMNGEPRENVVLPLLISRFPRLSSDSGYNGALGLASGGASGCGCRLEEGWLPEVAEWPKALD